MEQAAKLLHQHAADRGDLPMQTAEQEGKFSLRALQGTEGPVTSLERVSHDITLSAKLSLHVGNMSKLGVGRCRAALGPPCLGMLQAALAQVQQQHSRTKHSSPEVHCQASCQACAPQGPGLEPAGQDHCSVGSMLCDIPASSVRPHPYNDTAAPRPVRSAGTACVIGQSTPCLPAD